MIEVSRCTVFDQIPPMLPYFVVHREEDRALMLLQIQESMRNQPESVFVIQAVDSQHQLVGFLIAQNVGQYVWLAQAWSRSGNSFKVADAMWSRLLVWTAALGKTEIRAETRRSVPALFERFGFVELSRTITRSVDPSVLEHIARSLDNGRPVQTTQANHTEQPGSGAASAAQPASFVHQPADRSITTGLGPASEPVALVDDE